MPLSTPSPMRERTFPNVANTELFIRGSLRRRTVSVRNGNRVYSVRVSAATLYLGLGDLCTRV